MGLAWICEEAGLEVSMWSKLERCSLCIFFCVSMVSFIKLCTGRLGSADSVLIMGALLLKDVSVSM